MANSLDETIDSIALKNGLKNRESDPKPRLTPDPDPPRCVSCSNGPSLIDNFCEPCYRKHHIADKHRELDKLIHRMSELNTSLVTHEARLTEAKVRYNKAIKQNWTCSRGCGKIFTYYGELFAHEAEKACHSLHSNRPKSRRLDDGII